ncbi:hypothetical protein VN1272_03360 [Helicobacter pylori]|nr:hypothetical protein VN1272_03360 [Helicobacter pylori]
MAYKPSKKKLQTLREEPNLFSILDDGNVINTSSYKQELEPQVKEPQSSTTQNPNKEQEIKGNTKSDDEVKQHIEQVIEKEIGKGAEIISSKEVAITNNVDYYENEEELETTQSRSRR